MSYLITTDIATETVLTATVGQTVFSFDWPIFEDDELIVTVDGAVVADYVVTGAGDEEGGEVTFATPMSGGELVVLLRDVAARRTVDLPTTGPYSSDDIDREFDRVFAVMQQTKTAVGRALTVPAGEVAPSLPVPADIKNKYLVGSPDGLSFIPSSGTGADAGLRTDLGENGASMIGFTPQGTDAIDSTVDAELRRLAVTPQQFGAVSDDADAAEANVDAFATAAAHAIASGKALYVSAGEWFIKADDIATSGWIVDTLTNGKFILRGDGPSTVIKRADAPDGIANSQLLRIWMYDGSQVDIADISFDGNEANFPYDAGDTWAYQQAHTVEIISRSPFTTLAKSIRLNNIYMTGTVADGIKVASLSESFNASDIFSSGRTRRTRSDLQFSFLPKVATISDCILDDFEAEPVAAAASGACQMSLSNIHCRKTFDISLANAHAGTSLRVDGINVTQDLMDVEAAGGRSTMVMYGFEGRFVGGRFTTGLAHGEPSGYQLRNAKLTFEGTKFVIGPKTGLPTVAQHLIPYHAADGQYLDFINCTFEVAAGITTGYCIVPTNATSSADRYTRLINCNVTGAGSVEYTIHAYRCGTVVLEGGRLKGSVAAVKPENTTGQRLDLYIRNPMRWTAAEIMKNASGIAGTTNFILEGSWYGESLPLTTSLHSTFGSAATWRVNATMIVTSTPNARLRGAPGLKAKKVSPATTEAVQWLMAQGTTAASQTWTTTYTVP